jgi:hypothetical protein
MLITHKFYATAKYNIGKPVKDDKRPVIIFNNATKKDDQIYFRAGEKCTVTTTDFNTFTVHTYNKMIITIGESKDTDINANLRELFDTDFRLDFPYPPEWLKTNDRDKIYRYELAAHTEEDVHNYIENEMDIDTSKYDINAIAETVGERWSYEGDYDCTLDYWTNIENLINEVKENYVLAD